MSKFLMIIIVFLFSAITFGQTPEKMSYQAVLRDANNTLIVNQQVGMQISILQGENPLYVETHMPTTNSNGLVSLEIGNGSIVSGVFSQVDWSEGTYFIKTETDLSGGSSYTIIGTSQLLSVPYALHAKTAGGIDGSIYLSSDSTVQLKGVISNRINALSSSDGSISWSGTEGNLYELITIKDIIPNADGIIDIDIRGRGSSNAYGFLNVLQITEKGPN